METVTVALKANVALFQRKLEWMALLLESRDVRERLGGGLMDRLLKALASGRGDELSKLGPVTAAGAGNLSIEIQLGGILDEVFAALRALGFEFHDAPKENAHGTEKRDIRELGRQLLNQLPEADRRHWESFYAFEWPDLPVAASKREQPPLTEREEWVLEQLVDRLPRQGRI